MTREEKIEQLQDWVSKNHITTLDDLKLEISCAEYEGEPIDEYDDILSQMEWNSCDRCGNLDDNMNLYWLEYDEDLSENLLKNMAREGVEYCAVCEECKKELEKELV